MNCSTFAPKINLTMKKSILAMLTVVLTVSCSEKKEQPATSFVGPGCRCACQ